MVNCIEKQLQEYPSSCPEAREKNEIALSKKKLSPKHPIQCLSCLCFQSALNAWENKCGGSWPGAVATMPLFKVAGHFQYAPLRSPIENRLLSRGVACCLHCSCSKMVAKG
jgi:hypothetical protein